MLRNLSRVADEQMSCGVLFDIPKLDFRNVDFLGALNAAHNNNAKKEVPDVVMCVAVTSCRLWSKLICQSCSMELAPLQG